MSVKPISYRSLSKHFINTVRNGGKTLPMNSTISQKNLLWHCFAILTLILVEFNKFLGCLPIKILVLCLTFRAMESPCQFTKVPQLHTLLKYCAPTKLDATTPAECT